MENLRKGVDMMAKMADNRSFVKSLSFGPLFVNTFLKIFWAGNRDYSCSPALFALSWGGFDTG